MDIAIMLCTANDRRPAEENDVEAGAGQEARCGTDIGVEHGNGRAVMSGRTAHRH